MSSVTATAIPRQQLLSICGHIDVAVLVYRKSVEQARAGNQAEADRCKDNSISMLADLATDIEWCRKRTPGGTAVSNAIQTVENSLASANSSPTLAAVEALGQAAGQLLDDLNKMPAQHLLEALGLGTELPSQAKFRQTLQRLSATRPLLEIDVPARAVKLNWQAKSYLWQGVHDIAIRALDFIWRRKGMPANGPTIAVHIGRPKSRIDRHFQKLPIRVRHHIKGKPGTGYWV